MFTQNFFDIILKCSIVRVSFVDLRWAQLYVSLVRVKHHMIIIQLFVIVIGSLTRSIQWMKFSIVRSTRTILIIIMLPLDSKAWTLRIEKRKVGWSCATSWRRWRWWEMSVVPFLPPGAIKCILHLLISPNKSEKGYNESNIAGFICPTKL